MGQKSVGYALAKMLILLLVLQIVNSIQVSDTRTEVIYRQLQSLYEQIANKKVAILTNPTAVDGNQQLLFEHILFKRAQYNFSV